MNKGTWYKTCILDVSVLFLETGVSMIKGFSDLRILLTLSFLAPTIAMGSDLGVIEFEKSEMSCGETDVVSGTVEKGISASLDGYEYFQYEVGKGAKEISINKVKERCLEILVIAMGAFPGGPVSKIPETSLWWPYEYNFSCEKAWNDCKSRGGFFGSCTESVVADGLDSSLDGSGDVKYECQTDEKKLDDGQIGYISKCTCSLNKTLTLNFRFGCDACVGGACSQPLPPLPGTRE